MNKTQVGLTFDEITHEQVMVYQCDVCGARDFDAKECFWCKNKARLVKEHHAEEARAGWL